MRIINDLSKNAHRYDFPQAMRLLGHFTKNYVTKTKLVLKAEAMPTGDVSEIQYFSFKNNKIKIRLAKQALSGVKGVIPYYIYEELLSALHRDDHALKDFLDVFNQRYFEMVAQLEMMGSLTVQKELQPYKTELLNNIAALGKTKDKFFQYSLLLGQKSRNLVCLEQILNDYFPFNIEVSTKTEERRKLPIDSLTQIGTSRSYNNCIGQGFLLGKTCLTHFNHITVSIMPSSEVELSIIQNDANLANSMKELINHYLRDNTPVSIYLKVKRSYLSRPMLSTHSFKAAKLGEVDCLAPERKPEKLVNILLK
ncbi:type VI secretion system baseplate subunit TssG [Vibrio caribbeanicus]|uniref:type VI secretion system baseplate subunit TssG n=1 Tax=Vibrio caribbeanicus TaxID=701175 RepID=UPI0030D8CFE5